MRSINNNSYILQFSHCSNYLMRGRRFNFRFSKSNELIRNWTRTNKTLTTISEIAKYR